MTIDELDEQTHYIEFEGRRWKWPKKDKKLLQVNDWVHDLNAVLLEMARVDKPLRAAVQAGGACGIWPVTLAEHFGVVYTFEPDPLNFWCLSANVSHMPTQIMPVNAALGENTGRVTTKLHSSEKDNVGAYYTVDSEDGVPRMVLDNCGIGVVDLICLDVEGREVEALRGANQLIEKNRPFVMIEEKQLPQMGSDVNHSVGEATEWMEKIHGYKVVKKVHRDVILAP